jgi:phosphoglucomutase
MLIVYLCISTCVGEIVEQLQLLVEFAPQWISARPSSTGEHIYRYYYISFAKSRWFAPNHKLFVPKCLSQFLIRIDKRADMKHVSKILSQAK